jgi:endonuclease YncB( thermonuclease family)
VSAYNRRRGPTRPLWRTARDAVYFLAVLAAVLGMLNQYGLIELETLSGRYTINDGDSLEYKGERLRLRGIDAPELSQTCNDKFGMQYECGREAKRALQKLIGSSDMSCNLTSTDRYNRKLAYCTIEGLDINKEMVRLGWAVAYTDHVSTYTLAEREARNERRGIWAGTFEKPADYRIRNRRTSGSIIADSDDD